MEIRDAVVPQNYTAKDGSEKTSWYKVGVVFIKDGSMSMNTPLVNGGKIIFVKPKANDRANAPVPGREGFTPLTQDELKPDEDINF
jgi:lysozyme family protein